MRSKKWLNLMLVVCLLAALAITAPVANAAPAAAKAPQVNPSSASAERAPLGWLQNMCSSLSASILPSFPHWCGSGCFWDGGGCVCSAAVRPDPQGNRNPGPKASHK
jgi:hypothetical protein